MLENTRKLGIFGIVTLCLLTVVSLFVSAETVNVDQNFTRMLESIPWFGPMAVGFGLMICLAVLIIPLIIAILLCIWIYRDAEKRGKEGILWVILLLLATMFLNIIGLIIILVVWIAVRPPIKKKSE